MVNCTFTNTSYSCSTTAEYVGYMYIFTIVSISGIVLNIINLVVLTRTPVKMNQSTHMFLTALAVADLGGTVTVGPIGIVRCTKPKHEWEVFARSHYETYIFLPFTNTFASVSVYLTVVVSIERLICVKYSALSKRLGRKSMSQMCILCCAVVALGMNSPYLFYRTVNNEGALEKTEFGASAQFAKYLWARLGLNKIIPIIIVAVSNALLVTTVVNSTRNAKSLVFPHTAQARRQRQQTRLTIMMMSISVVFIVCHILEPFSHGPAYEAIFGPCSTFTPKYRIITMVTNTLETLSYSSNFVFYCIFHRQFLKGLKHIMCCCLDNKIIPKVSSSVGVEPSGQTETKQLSSKNKEKQHTCTKASPARQTDSL